MDQPNKTYEMLYFLAITLTDEEIKTIKNKIHEIFDKYQVTIIKEEDLGKRKLAYMIKRARHGYYALIEFNASPAIINNLRHQLKLMTEIIRYRIITKEKNTSSPIRIKNSKIDNTQTQTNKLTKTPLSSSNVSKEETTSTTKKVDTQELNRKIDELLSDNI